MSKDTYQYAVLLSIEYINSRGMSLLYINKHLKDTDNEIHFDNSTVC